MIEHTQKIWLIEELAANAWPAPVTQTFERWRFRAAQGVTRRANSVFTGGPVPGNPAWLAEAESFYHRRGLPVRFQVSDGTPQELVALLDRSGYSEEAHSSVQTAPVTVVMGRCQPDPKLLIEICPVVSDEWFAHFVRLEGHSEEKHTMYRRIVEAIGPAALFVLAQLEGETVGIGTGVCERGWAGLTNIVTHPDARRQGVATGIIRAITEWAIEQGAHSLYLQVMQNNASALHLYEKLGFVPLYSYHYRTEQKTTD